MIKKITIDQVRQGMYVHALGGSWLNNPFWAPSFAVDSHELVHKLKTCGVKDLQIDLSKGVDVAGEAETAPATAIAEAPPAAEVFRFKKVQATGMVDELHHAARLVKQSKQAISEMFDDVRMGRLQDVQTVMPLVEDIASSVIRNPGALVSLVRLKQADDYTYLHSVAVSAMMVALGKQIGLSDAELRDCGLAGLLHDIGKAVVPLAILNKPGKLTDDEFKAVKQHSLGGYEILVAAGNAPPIALDVCLHHHEKFDGTGYPHGLKGDAISLHARMGAICDVYDAVTSNRPYKAGWCPAESLRRMAEWAKGGHFDPQLFAAFVKCIGIFPVGTLVKLKSGRLAVVVDNSKSLLQPLVRIFYSTKSMSYIPPLSLDLSTAGALDSIAGREDAERWGLKDIDRYWLDAA
ncbi:DUF3391 domain-containing protein [Pseudoduganella eburnea]|uniref:DUF3391 domain-containing protein n=1 Tax=Massilia eburnea TaxID=1776165 RepID=A0A6L6QF10_9BURK|nr:HD-GYP domain-containing protein [Massilia eburnea]MTW10972.1 DUF3391 domain-containing protein [Massilia eburnea]